eukprot:jgi/Mesen1/9194/ME000591S08514
MANVDVLQVVKDVWNDMGPSATLSLSAVAAFGPIVLAGLFYMGKVGFFLPVLLGGVTGLGMMAVFMSFQLHRSKSRRRRAAAVSANQFLGAEEIKKLMHSDTLPSWVNFPTYEKVNWLNNQLMEVWPYLNKASCEMIREQLTPILDQYKMGLLTKIEVKSLTLGDYGPRITGVRTLKGKPDDCIFEAQLDWRQARDQKMVLKVVTTGPDFEVKVDDIQIYGIAHMVFKPLVDEIPGFGAILFSLREPPVIDFKIGLAGGELNMIPGLDRMIDNMIKTAVVDMLVWPSRIVIPIAAGDYSYLELRPMGYLDVQLIEAKDVPKTDVIGKTDPFCFLYVRQKEGVIKRSSTKKKTLAPVWNEGFYIEVEDEESQALTVRLMDDESIEKSEFVGSAELPIKQLQAGKPNDLWLKLAQDPKNPNQGKPCGSVHINVTYFPYRSDEDRMKSPARKKEEKTTPEGKVTVAADPPANSAEAEEKRAREEQEKEEEYRKMNATRAGDGEEPNEFAEGENEGGKPKGIKKATHWVSSHLHRRKSAQGSEVEGGTHVEMENAQVHDVRSDGPPGGAGGYAAEADAQ